MCRLSFPNSTIRSQNAGIGGVTSTYYAQCVDMFVADEDVDLVIVDFTLNDMASGDKKRSPEFDTADRWALRASPQTALWHIHVQNAALQYLPPAHCPVQTHGAVEQT